MPTSVNTQSKTNKSWLHGELWPAYTAYGTTSLIVNISHFSLYSTNLSISPFDLSMLVVEQEPDTAGRMASSQHERIYWGLGRPFLLLLLRKMGLSQLSLAMNASFLVRVWKRTSRVHWRTGIWGKLSLRCRLEAITKYNYKTHAIQTHFVHELEQCVLIP